MRVNDEILNNIKKKDFFLYNHFDDFLYMHNSFKHCVSKISKPICNSETRINDDESMAISKKIIEYINPNYISTFNYIIDNKNIVFDSDSNGSRFTATDWNDKQTWKIIIEEKNNYDNVISIIHEFMHYKNAIDGVSFNRDVFGEFISIYFEKQAEQFLINNNVFKTELGTYNRLFDTYELLTIAFDEEKNYFSSTLGNITLSNRVDAYFKHLFGLLLSEWTIKNNVDISKIIYLNDNISKFEGINHIFEYLGISNIRQLTDDAINIINDKMSNVIMIK